jgi:hypothetical protein
MSVRSDRIAVLGGFTPWVALVVVEFLLVLAYFVTASVRVLEPRYVLYPFVTFVAVSYFLVLGWLTGLLSVTPEVAGVASGGVTVLVNEAPPGWGPRVTLATDVVQLVVVPYRIVGYAGLAVLVYDGVLDAAASTVSGVAGLFSCVGCAFPLVGSTLATLGGSSALVLAVRTYSVDLSTLVFVLAVGLLVWRPSLEDLRVWAD